MLLHFSSNRSRKTTALTIRCTTSVLRLGMRHSCSSPLVQDGLVVYTCTRAPLWQPVTANTDAGVCENTSLLRGPLPCNPAAETALQPMIWCSESLFSHLSASPEYCFFTDSGIHVWAGQAARQPGIGATQVGLSDDRAQVLLVRNTRCFHHALPSYVQSTN